MNKIIQAEKKLKKAIDQGTACYVLITCSQPNEEGKMEVDLTYAGDETLAAYLVENAAHVFESKAHLEESK